MHAACSKSLIFVGISFLIVAVVYSSFSKSYVAFAAISYGPIQCERGTIGYLIVCCQTQTDDEGIEMEWCTMCDNLDPPSNCSSRYQHAGAPPPPSTGTCPDPNQALGATGNCAPLTQTPEAPVPKSGPRNLLPEGVFGGPTTSPQQGEMTPEVAPPTGPEVDNETQSRINTSPTGYCVPIRSPTCIPCDPGLPGSTCIPGSDWPPASIGTPDTGTPEEAKPLVPPTTEETAPQVAPPPSTAVEEPECPEGQEFNEETGLCVLEEAPVTEQQEQPEEQEQSDQQDESN